MNKCKRCNVEVLDDVKVCPFCETVLTVDDKPQIDTYPDIRKKTRIMKRIVSIGTYFLVVLGIVFCLLDYYGDRKMSWSLITAVCFLYGIVTFHYSFNRRNGHIRKIFVQAATAILFILCLDGLTGATGWAVWYGIPIEILLLNGILVVCMLVNFKNWQSYLLVQLFSMFVSLVLLVLYFAGVTKSPVLPWVTFGASAAIFFFCFSVGYRKAKNELYRRFYI